MQPQDIVENLFKRVSADVVLQQPWVDLSLHCQSGAISAIFAQGRTQAVCLVKRGERAKGPKFLQEDWSRGCRRAHALFLHLLWLPLWPLALRKKKKSFMWMSRSQPSLPTPANTSDDLRRAGRGNLIRRAAFSGARHQSALAPLARLHYTTAAFTLQDRSTC